MTTNLRVGDVFPDFELPDHRKQPRRLSGYVKPQSHGREARLHRRLPARRDLRSGVFLPARPAAHAPTRAVPVRAGGQLRQARDGQHRRAAGGGRLSRRARGGVALPLDERREVIRVGILDETEGEYAYVSQPFTFVLRPDLTIHKIYDGWFFVGRPTLEELRQDLREIMERAVGLPLRGLRHAGGQKDPHPPAGVDRRRAATRRERSPGGAGRGGLFRPGRRRGRDRERRLGERRVLQLHRHPGRGIPHP